MNNERDKMNGWEFLTFLTIDLSALWLLNKWFKQKSATKEEEK